MRSAVVACEGLTQRLQVLHTERFILIWVWFVQDLDVLLIVPAAAGRSRDDESGKTNSFTKLKNLCFACQPVTPK